MRISSRSISPIPESIPTSESEIGVGESVAAVSYGCVSTGIGKCIITFIRPVGILGGTSMVIRRSAGMSTVCSIVIR
ncbi:MAG: hypothetical protein LBC76_03150 [Treponema sp.]|nr:hypothetical protein [Treponema sp.]